MRLTAVFKGKEFYPKYGIFSSRAFFSTRVEKTEPESNVLIQDSCQIVLAATR